ncbi:penicillin-binding protein 1C [Pasteurella canis]|uniref:penicillin-binding protein 1C n=1 Tax=Pasteurella canis TaxID=753 RepID=UPI00066763C8|nr:penicillin-binding protein 1C [Pasteurella canis]GJJ79339.1 penicillin-binding protein 1C [Pasteurella canis]
MKTLSKKVIFRLFLTVLLLGSVTTIIRLSHYTPLKDYFPYSTAIYDDKNNLLRLTTAKDERYRLWTPLEEISPKLIEAVLFQEDEWFYYHFGVNPYGLIRGAWQTYILNNSPQGGSTITMQLARVLWHIDSRTLVGKAEQILRAIELEIRYSKKEILEAYFNFAPYGRNIEGAGTASLIYFNKSNSQINLAEAMTLAILPKNPNVYIRQHNSQLNPALFKARNQLYHRWLITHPEDKKWHTDFQLSYALRPLEKLPFLAPHFVDQLLQQYPNRPKLISTLNSHLQSLIESITHRYLSQQYQTGINNASVLLVDNETMAVKALIGSGNYFDQRISGQINGTLAKRSYGSTLKPFIYALAFDQGLAHSQTILKDLPTIFSEYQPENYEGNFVGPISVTQALLQSRNIPAIEIASRLSPDLYDFLQQANITFTKNKAHYGLSLVLGGSELNAQQLASLYAMLANQGIWSPLKFLKEEKSYLKKQLLSKESTIMIHDILRKNIRTDIQNKSIKSNLPLYWKTGTSNGLRDAWTAGYFGRYTLVVWLGNFNNKSNPYLIGRNVATPLFLQLADSIIANEPQMSDIVTEGANLKEVFVCQADGNLPNQHCPQQVKTLFIPGKSPITVSQLYQPFIVLKNTDILACQPYSDKDIEQKIYEMWSSDFQQLFAQAGVMKRTPIINPACPYEQQNQALQYLYQNNPQITSPLAERDYYISHQIQSEPLILSANVAADVRKVFWFIDNAFISEALPNQPILWQPNSMGSYIISILDDQGRADSVQIKINAF